MSLVGRYTPQLVGHAAQGDDAPAKPQATLAIGNLLVPVCVAWDGGPARLDDWWRGTALQAAQVADLGSVLLALEPAALLMARGQRTYVAWDGAERPLEGMGLALLAREVADPKLEAERLRRILSWAPRRFVEEMGLRETPSLLVYGDMRVVRELPGGLYDVAVVNHRAWLTDDINLAREVIVWCDEPQTTPPEWAGLPTMIGPRHFWHAPWMQDPRCQQRH